MIDNRRGDDFFRVAKILRTSSQKYELVYRIHTNPKDGVAPTLRIDEFFADDSNKGKDKLKTSDVAPAQHITASESRLNRTTVFVHELEHKNVKLLRVFVTWQLEGGDRQITDRFTIDHDRAIQAPKTRPVDIVVLIPEGKDVMIIPKLTGARPPVDPHNKGLFEENRKFAEQWKDAEPKARHTEEVQANGSLDDFKKAVKKAAARASGKEVIIFTGHGAIKGLRGAAETAFDSVPEGEGMSTHKHIITADVVFLEKIAKKKANGDWVAKPFGPFKRTETAKVKKLAPRRKMLEEIGKILKQKGVLRLRLLTCNIGKDIAFLKKLAQIIGIEVVAYTKFTQTREQRFTLGTQTTVKVQCWVGRLRPPHPRVKDENDPQFTEIPHTFEVFSKPLSKKP